MSNNPPNNDLLTEYRERRELYADLAATVSSLVSRILQEGGINIHSVTHRDKDLTSLSRKVTQEGRSYTTLADVTDLAGVRVTTYFHDDVDKSAKLIEREFKIDVRNSIDKRTLLDPDRFGYVSLHYVLALLPNRSQLPEYRRFQHLQVELQLRSLLQHVWAEIEHDLGYKSTRSVPVVTRRRFARLAGLLELADAEFVAIRDDLTTYEREVPQLIEVHPDTVLLDRASLLAFMRENEVSRRLDIEIASHPGASIEPADDAFVSALLNHLSFIGIKTVAALDTVLRQNEDAIKRFAKPWFGASTYDHLSEGISLFYLTYVMLAKAHNKERLIEWVEAFRFGERENLVERVIDTANEAGI